MVYIRHMIRTQIYLPEDLYREIGWLAKKEKKAKAQVIREALEHSLESRRETIGEALGKLIKLGEKLHLHGPKDLSINHDKYLYEDL